MPLRSAQNGEEMGRNEVSAFVCKASGWGHMGRNGVSPLEMGIEGRGRGIRHPHSPKAEVAEELERSMTTRARARAKF
jgi:hypothetical protein